MEWSERRPEQIDRRRGSHAGAPSGALVTGRWSGPGRNVRRADVEMASIEENQLDALVDLINHEHEQVIEEAREHEQKGAKMSLESEKTDVVDLGHCLARLKTGQNKEPVLEIASPMPCFSPVLCFGEDGVFYRAQFVAVVGRPALKKLAQALKGIE